MSTAKWITAIIEAQSKGTIVVAVGNDSLYAFRPGSGDDFTDADDIKIPGPRQALHDLLAASGIDSCDS